MSTTLQTEQHQVDCIFIGKKPIMSYVMPAMSRLAQNGSVTLRARGSLVSRAVDVAEIIKRLANCSVMDVKIGTEKLGETGSLRNVSTISITLRSA